MSTDLQLGGVRAAMTVMGCADLPPMLDFFVGRLGWRIDAIFPADGPRHAMLSGHGSRLHLRVGEAAGLASLELLCDDPDAVAGGTRELLAPNGVRVRLLHADPPMRQPATRQALVIARSDASAHWAVGRAGLRYRDLLPERHGGAFIASHIRILDGGPVPDYVHYHKVRFQVIYCRKGWVKVAYEGQGEPFVMNAGDCALQPPEIRHRVLESSAGCEVVELASPAEHITLAEHAMDLPNGVYPTDHDFSGQRFVRHIAAQAGWSPWRLPGFEARDTGIAAATDGLAGVRVLRCGGEQPAQWQTHAHEFCFYFVLSGRLRVEVDGQAHELAADDSITLPGDMAYAMAPLGGCELLEVSLPGLLAPVAVPPQAQAVPA
jgi:quercetin dioxygenase-like cupin family protein